MQWKNTHKRYTELVLIDLLRYSLQPNGRTVISTELYWNTTEQSEDRDLIAYKEIASRRQG